MQKWTGLLGIVLIVAAFLGTAAVSGRLEARRADEQLESFRANGCKRTGYHPDNAYIGLWTCPDGTVYKRREH